MSYLILSLIIFFSVVFLYIIINIITNMDFINWRIKREGGKFYLQKKEWVFWYFIPTYCYWVDIDKRGE